VVSSELLWNRGRLKQTGSSGGRNLNVKCPVLSSDLHRYINISKKIALCVSDVNDIKLYSDTLERCQTMILSNVEQDVAAYDLWGLHYNLVADAIYRVRNQIGNPFSEDYLRFNLEYADR